ncbi:PF01934 family protein [Leptospira wolbachii serovar Codice str. CDC]|uniref:PF01934 family protein n=1 Tax=Leptospira wolbachii serovar Codice str. CDC TaxID=1218599 RepID=R8ZYH8_9LEPT|nr:PF01934 family protein [Leptospira wolbachii serovar Codice str. CDC]
MFIKDELPKTDAALFLNNNVLKRAFVRSIEIIGEASNKLSDSFKKKYNEPEWRKFSATRNHLIHGYFIVDYDIVWDLVKNKIPVLEVQIKEILQKEKTLFD